MKRTLSLSSTTDTTGRGPTDDDTSDDDEGAPMGRGRLGAEGDDMPSPLAEASEGGPLLLMSCGRMRFLPSL